MSKKKRGNKQSAYERQARMNGAGKKKNWQMNDWKSPKVEHSSISMNAAGLPGMPGNTMIVRKSKIVKTGTTKRLIPQSKSEEEALRKYGNDKFIASEIITDRVITDGIDGSLTALVAFLEDDLEQNGKLAPYYFYHASSEKLGIFPIQAIDEEKMFVGQVKEMIQHAKQHGYSFLTETKIFDNLKINDFVIKRLEMKAIVADYLHTDPMPAQFGIWYMTGVNSYLKITI